MYEAGSNSFVLFPGKWIETTNAIGINASEIVGVGNAHRLQEEISHLAWADMEPQIRPEFAVEMFDGKTVVISDLPMWIQ